MNWLYYLAEANIYLGVFYLAYCIFLTKETYYQLTRAYLIFSCIVSFALPVLQIGALKPVEVAANTAVNYTVPVIHTTQTASSIIAPVTIEHPLSMQDYLWDGYLLGAGIVLIILIIKLYTLFKLMRNADCVGRDNYKIVYLSGSDVAFSFFNYLFIGTNAAGADIITRHELVHIRQKHSADIIFLELLKIINWFNPFIYLLQNSLKTVHEYIADEQTAIYEKDALTYSSFLVNNAYGAGGSSITHSFFNYNLLKKRIIMLNQQRSGNLARLKYLMAVPICAGLLCASTLAFSKTYGWVDLVPKNKIQRPLPPPPPAPPSNTRITGKGYKVEETAYLVNNKAIYRVTITEKNGVEKEYFTNKVTPAEIKLLKDKYGYTFPAIPIYSRLPPPPPMITQKVKFPPPVVKPNNQVKLPPPVVKPDNQVLPPIVRIDTISKGFNNAFTKYLARNIHYPTDARNNNITGRVIAIFTVEGNKMKDIKVVRGIGHGADEEVLRVLKNYEQPLDIPQGKYAVPVFFAIADYDEQTGRPDDKAKTAAIINPNSPNKNTVWALDEVVIIAYPTQK
ncbi:M56 family metallopeptidase [Mucilaginibacter sp.]|uniref:M56 family metallopeptidase n=1 Tax=Mucilaginibacter sp. TaxID=1882438 RepID=UPI00262826FE|nr:M56 family metallopeptidase [Mucilaginibacter sp.]MDB5030716.1 hypothetical protein [Mucilaginibacter sp.]